MFCQKTLPRGSQSLWFAEILVMSGCPTTFLAEELWVSHQPFVFLFPVNAHLQKLWSFQITNVF